ncbi:MAG TPA: hypothetical protein G4N96_11040 [Chloroflexi bacterium]|nr:hypothetical protein [Chloroflexota bacterium]
MKTTIFKPFPLFMLAVALIMVGIVLTIPQPAQAQCGSSASSCKSCHETQGADPVNAEGDWHIQHAFGDFCEFCHAGNVQAADKDAAHEGLAVPMDDVAASCQGCHPQDLMERSEIYASTLGVDLSAGGSGGNPGNSTAGEDASSTDDCGSNVAAPLGGEEIDFNLLYVEKTAPKPFIANWGNLILILMLFGLGGAFFLVAWSWEGWGPVAAKWIKENLTVVRNAALEANASVNQANVPTQAEINALFEKRPALKDLWPQLADSSPEFLADLNQLLSNEKEGAHLLHLVTHMKFKQQAQH